MSKDERYVYGARCTWSGSISEVGTKDTGNFKLPCCPHCGGMLFEMPTRKQWDDGVAKYDATHPGYKDMIDWAEGKCFPNLAALTKAYEARETT